MMPLLRRLLLLLGSLVVALRGDSVPMWIAGDGGIFQVELDTRSGALTVPRLVQAMGSGSWLVTHPQHRLLYVSFQEDGAGGVAVFRYAEDGALEAWERASVPSGSPTHIAIDPAGRTLATAHWGRGTTSLLKLRPDGGFVAAEAFTLEMPFRGQGPQAVQSQSRTHWVGYSADGLRLHVPDLGNDTVWTLAVDPTAGTLAVADRVDLSRGAGPRHLDVHPTLPFAYVNGELGSVVAQVRREPGPERFTLVQEWPTLGEGDDAPTNNTSEVRVHPSGKFLYVGNRGHDSIAVFGIDPRSGALTPVEREAVRGSWPRNFNIDPSGRWLVAAGQRSGTLASFAIDPETGALRYSLNVVSVPGPVRVLFVP